MSYRIGIDVGGTFTDLLLLSESGESRVFKTSSTPEDPSIGLMNGLNEMAEEANLTLPEFLAKVDVVVHGTTVATNAVLTGGGAATGLLTTRGFRDALQMRRGIRESQYDNRYTAPEPLVPRHLRLTARERLDYRGEVQMPLEAEDVSEAASKFRAGGVQAVAICFLHSHANSRHEDMAAEILKRELPDVYLSISSELMPQIRFYDRTSTTVLNSYVGPLIRRYLESLLRRLDQAGFKGVLLVMQSNGGVAAAQQSIQVAAATVLSGPAAGPVAGLAYVAPHDFADCITIDMGGTSFDAALIVNRQPIVTTEGRINGHLMGLPKLDIHTIGAGGGSIGWIDPGGFLRMGPQSAGAVPGPACYGRGGELPTCSDADLVLGYLNPEYFLGGKIPLSAQRARDAIERHIAQPLGISVEQAAAGMFTVINHGMANGIREISVQRGYDPRDFPLVVAGGAGPIHAATIAGELGIPLLLVPRASSIFCAAGMLLSDLKHAFVRTYPVRLSELDPARLNQLCEEMRAEADELLKRERIPRERRRMLFSSDLRCVGQFNEVNIPLPDMDLEALARRFHTRHDRLYGYAVPDAPLEMVTVRLTAIGVTEKPELPRGNRQPADGSAHLRGRRLVYLPQRQDFEEVPVYDGDRLDFGNLISGPALIEQVTSTLFVPSDYEVICDCLGSFAVYLKEHRHRYAEQLAREWKQTLDEVVESYD